jgi:nucleoside-diphosphate-sugar epimerase
VKLLFIGGTGNISSACVDAALGRGHEVTLLTRGRRPQRSGARLRALVGDRDDASLLRRAAAEGPDAVVDFVAYAPEQVEAAIAAFAERTRQYVFISSAAVYARPAAQPLLSEASPLGNPHWHYARQKIRCEERLRAAQRERGFPITIVRPSFTYGPTWIPCAVGGHDFTLVDRIRSGRPIISHGDGSSLWVMTFHSDFARGLLGLLGDPRALGEAFHVTSDEVLSWDQIYRVIARAAGREAEIVHVPSDLIAALWPERAGSLLGDKALGAIFDNAKLRSLVPDYRASVPFAEGVARALAWFDADPARRVVSDETNRAMDRVIAAQRRAFA